MERALLCLLLSSGCAALAAPEGVAVRRDLPYWRGPEADPIKHRLDLFVPRPAPSGAPVIVFVHGGGWRAGDRRAPLDLYGRMARRLAADGFVVAVVSYRLAPKVRHPEPIRDVARAVVSVWRNAAAVGGDPTRVVLLGHSAGAHLVTLLALDRRWLEEWGGSPRRLAGVVAVSGVYDLLALADDRRDLVTGAFGWDRQVWLDASPFSHVGEGRPPPFLVARGEDEWPILAADQERLVQALAARGGRVQSLIVPGRGHVSVLLALGTPSDPLTAALAGFAKPARATGARAR